MSRSIPFARELLHWEVIAVLPSGNGHRGADGLHARCRHRHETAAEATMCPWTPTPWPYCCDLLVRQLRSEDQQEQAAMPW